MPNITPKQRAKLKQLKDLAKKAKESGLNISVDSLTEIRIDLTEAQNDDKSEKNR